MRKIIAIVVSDRGLKTLIGIKLTALVVLFLYDGGHISFGERPVVAEEGGKRGDVVAENTAQDSMGEDYLGKLLDLPAVDESKLKKDEIARYFELLERKNSQVKERMETLVHREKALKQLEKSVAQKIKYLEEERRLFAESVQQEKKVKKERLENVIEFYRKMAPKRAAPIFEKMDKDLVVSVFKRLPVKQTMGILEKMDAEKSVEYTEYYSRIKSGKEYDLLKEVNQSLVSEFKDHCGETRERAPTEDELTADGL